MENFYPQVLKPLGSYTQVFTVTAHFSYVGMKRNFSHSVLPVKSNRVRKTYISHVKATRVKGVLVQHEGKHFELNIMLQIHLLNKSEDTSKF